MIKSIVVPLDGSAAAEVVLPYVEAIARKSGASIHLFTVMHDRVVWGDAPKKAEQGVETDRARAYLAEKIDALQKKGLTVDGEVAYGPEAEAILTRAEEIPTDLIAMATHGRSGLTRWTVGSVADAVVRESQRPVLLARSEAPVPSEPKIDRILVPLDGSELSESVLPYVEDFAKLFGASLVLFHAVAPINIYPGPDVAVANIGTILQDLEQDASSHLNALAKKLEERGLKTHCLVTMGSSVWEITRVAEDSGAGLIAMATHGRSGLGRWVMGSVADGVLRRSKLPCLVIRPAAAQKAAQ